MEDRILKPVGGIHTPTMLNPKTGDFHGNHGLTIGEPGYYIAGGAPQKFDLCNVEAWEQKKLLWTTWYRMGAVPNTVRDAAIVIAPHSLQIVEGPACLNFNPLNTLNSSIL